MGWFTGNMFITLLVGAMLIMAASTGRAYYPGRGEVGRRQTPWGYWIVMLVWIIIFVMGCIYSWMDLHRLGYIN